MIDVVAMDVVVIGVVVIDVVAMTGVVIDVVAMGVVSKLLRNGTARVGSTPGQGHVSFPVIPG